MRAYGTTTASAYLAAGAYEDARAEIHQGLAAAAERHAHGHLASLQRLAAEVLRHDDDYAGARARLNAALATAADHEMRPEVAHCYLALGKLYRGTGKREHAQEHLTTATTMYREMGMTYWLERADGPRNRRAACLARNSGSDAHSPPNRRSHCARRAGAGSSRAHCGSQADRISRD